MWQLWELATLGLLRSLLSGIQVLNNNRTSLVMFLVLSHNRTSLVMLLVLSHSRTSLVSVQVLSPISLQLEVVVATVVVAVGQFLGAGSVISLATYSPVVGLRVL